MGLMSKIKSLIRTNESNQNGKFEDFFSFVARTYGKSVNRRTIESLIDADIIIGNKNW